MTREEHLRIAESVEQRKPVYHVTGVLRDGKRFKRIVTDNALHALGINLWLGSVWKVRSDGSRTLVKRVTN
jgi:hypothetical protein